jgi:hypothetical protein
MFGASANSSPTSYDAYYEKSNNFINETVLVHYQLVVFDQ